MSARDETELRRVVQEYERLGKAGNLDKRAELFHVDGVFYDPVALRSEFSDIAEDGLAGMAAAFRGRQNLVEFWTRVRAIYPGLSAVMDITLVDTTTSTVAFEWNGRYERGGRTHTIRALDVFELEDGLIRTARGYIARPDTFE